MLVGMDLGATNSLAGVFRGEGVRLVPNALGAVLTPFCISLDEDGSVLEMFEGVMEVRPTAGDNFLGGGDFWGVVEQVDAGRTLGPCWQADEHRLRRLKTSHATTP